MRTVEISDEVWAEIAKRGKFGEIEDDVLRREFGLPARTGVMLQSGRSVSTASQSGPHRRAAAGDGPRKRIADVRMSSFVRDQSLVVDFHGGPRRTFALPDRADKQALRRVRDTAVAFARESGASYGQEMAVKKALTEAGYHLVK